MASNDFNYEGNLPVNFDQKCPLVLVLDTSGSMHGTPIVELNKGLQEFHTAIKNDIVASSKLDISIITFGSQIEIIQDFDNINHFQIPELSPSGSTPLVDAMAKAFKLIDNRKQWYKETGQTYYRPYIVLITDGYPDHNQNTKWLKEQVATRTESNQVNCWFFGVEGADMSQLQMMAHKASLVQKLAGLKFVEFFKWLSHSMTMVANSREGDQVDFSPTSQENNPFQHTV